MALYAQIDFDKGLTSERFGRAATNTGVTLVKDSKGYAAKTGSNQYLQYSSQLLPANAFSVVVWAKIKATHVFGTDRATSIEGQTGGSLTYGSLSFSHSDGGTGKPYLGLGASNYRVFNWTPDKFWHCFVFTCPGSIQASLSTSQFFVDAISITAGTTDTTGSQVARSGLVTVGGGNNASGGCSISKIKVYDTVLTQEEINKEQAEFEAAKPRGKSIRNFNYPKPKDTSRLKGSGANQGLVAHYNMIPNADGSLTDISGNGKTATKSGVPMQTENGLVFHGSPDKYTIGNLGTHIKSIQFRIKLNSTSEKIIEGDINSHLIYVTNGTLTANTFNVIYIDGIVGTSMVAGKWHNVVLTLGNTGLFKLCTLALNDATYGQFEIEDLSFWNRALSAQEAKEYNNKYASQKYLSEHFETLDCSGNNVLPDNWIAGTGLYKGYELPTDVVSGGLRLRKGTRFLQCTSAGTIALPSNWVNGAVEFDFYKGADANSFKIGIIADRINTYALMQGYMIIPESNERIYFSKSDAGSASDKFTTAVSYFNKNTYYRIRITRTPAGVFTLFIKGGSFTPTAGYNGWTLVSVTGGGGTNPVSDSVYNTSNFLVLDLDTNDRFGNLDMFKGIIT